MVIWLQGPRRKSTWAINEYLWSQCDILSAFLPFLYFSYTSLKRNLKFQIILLVGKKYCHFLYDTSTSMRTVNDWQSPSMILLSFKNLRNKVQWSKWVSQKNNLCVVISCELFFTNINNTNWAYRPTFDTQNNLSTYLLLYTLHIKTTKICVAVIIFCVLCILKTNKNFLIYFRFQIEDNLTRKWYWNLNCTISD